MADRYEYFIASDDSLTSLYDPYRRGMTFTPQASHKITSVKLKLYRQGNPGNLLVHIVTVDGDQHPTDNILCSGLIDGNGLTTNSAGQVYEITLGAGAKLTAGIMYAIYFYIEAGNATNRVMARYEKDGNPYTRGAYETSSDGGATWTKMANYDFYFEEWGILPIELPIVTTEPATLITQTTAQLNATLDDDGGEACDVRFNYGETEAYGFNTDWQPGIETNDPVYAAIENLDPDTTYHFRAEAKNSEGTIYGDDAEFTTQPIPPPQGKVVKALITHPAILRVCVYAEGQVVADYDQLSDLDDQRIESSIELPVPTPCTIEVTTLAGQVFSYQIPLKV